MAGKDRIVYRNADKDWVNKGIGADRTSSKHDTHKASRESR